MRSLRKRMKAVSTYVAERREADRFQPDGWETAEGAALLSQYRKEMNDRTPAADITGETVAVPTAASKEAADEAARHASREVAADTEHRPRHDGTQRQVGPSYLLTQPRVTEHGTPAAAETARVLTITNVVRGPDGDPLAGAIVTISLIADRGVAGVDANATIDGVARSLVCLPAHRGDPAA